MQSTC